MTVNKISTSVVPDRMPYGVYVWVMPDGRWVGDDDGHYLCINSIKGDKKKIAQLTQAVRSYGVREGFPWWLSGKRQVSDEEYDHQRQRMEWGLTPDPMDVAPELDRHLRGHGR